MNRGRGPLDPERHPVVTVTGAMSPHALTAQQCARAAAMLRAGVILACLWPLCHPVPASAAPCTQAIPLTQPCEGILVPVTDLLACATDRADLAACMAHRERERTTCERERGIDREAAAVQVATALAERDAARARADAMAPDDSGPSWWAVIGAGAVGVAVGVVVGVVLAGR